MNTFFTTIIRYSMQHKVTVLVCTALVVILGVWSLTTMKIDVLPDVNKPTVAIFAESDGLASEEIERLIVNPIELAVAGVPGAERIRSTSSFGIGIVNVEFKWGSDIYRNRQLIQEQLVQANLPSNVRPVLGPTTSVMGEIVWVGITSTDSAVTPMQLRTIADWTVRPALLRIPGITQVLVMGGDVKEWQININAQALQRYGLKLEDVEMNVRGALRNRGAGILNQSGMEYPIRIIVAPAKPSDLEAIAVGLAGDKVVRLGDVARVEEQPSILRGTAAVDGKPGVILRIVRQGETETIKVTKAIDEQLAALQKSLPKGVEIKNDLLRQEWFIHDGLKNVMDALRDGTILLIIILFLFLMNVRITLITLITIPLSIFVTAIVFRSMGFSINVMTLGGLAVAIGELVDDAIVGIENVYRRLRERNASTTDVLHADTVITDASCEVRNSIVYATLLVVIAFVPVFFIPGMEGRLLTPLSAAYIVSLIASMAVSLTVTPVLCSYFLSRVSVAAHKETKFVSWLKRTLSPLVEWSIDHPRILIGIVIATLVVSAGLYVITGKEGIPPFNENSATIMVILPVGTSLDETNKTVTAIENDMKKLPGVGRISHTSGRSSADSHGGGSNSSEMQIVFDKEKSGGKETMFKRFQEVLDHYKGAEYSLGQPITHRLEELLSGVRAPIVIKVFGDNTNDLKAVADMVRVELSKQPGVKNARVQKDVTVPEFRIYPLTDRLAQSGISSARVADELEMGLMGEPIQTVPVENQRINVVMRYDLASRGNAQALSDLSLPFGAGGESLGSVADVRIEGGRNRYSHEGGRRVLIVSANYQGKNIVGAVENVKKALDAKEKPIGTLISYEGTYKSQKENSLRLAIFFMVGIVLIFLILFQAFRSIPIVFQIMLSIPTVFIGGLVGIALTGNIMSLAHMVGFISLTGIVSRNGIMLISRALTLIRQGAPFTKETVIQATLDRVTPVLMTSSVTALALVPLLLARNEPGKELLNPLAVVIFGGLLSSTIISLFLTPSIFYRFGKKSALKSGQDITGF